MISPSFFFPFFFSCLVQLTLAESSCPENFTMSGELCFQETKLFRQGLTAQKFKVVCSDLAEGAEPFDFLSASQELVDDVIELVGTGTVEYFLDTIRPELSWLLDNDKVIIPTDRECNKRCLTYNAVNGTHQPIRCNMLRNGICFLPSSDVITTKYPTTYKSRTTKVPDTTKLLTNTKFPITQEAPFVRDDLWMPNGEQEGRINAMALSRISHGWSSWADKEDGQPTQCIHTGCDQEGIEQERECDDCDSGALKETRKRCHANTFPYADKWMKSRTTTYKVTCDGNCNDVTISIKFNTAGKLYLEENDPTSYSGVFCGSSQRPCLTGIRKVAKGGGTISVQSINWYPRQVSSFYMTVVATQTGKVSLDVQGATAMCYASYKE